MLCYRNMSGFWMREYALEYYSNMSKYAWNHHAETEPKIPVHAK